MEMEDIKVKSNYKWPPFWVLITEFAIILLILYIGMTIEMGLVYAGYLLQAYLWVITLVGLSVRYILTGEEKNIKELALPLNALSGIVIFFLGSFLLSITLSLPFNQSRVLLWVVLVILGAFLFLIGLMITLFPNDIKLVCEG
jgi:hypothetical protein